MIPSCPISRNSLYHRLLSSENLPDVKLRSAIQGQYSPGTLLQSHYMTAVLSDGRSQNIQMRLKCIGLIKLKTIFALPSECLSGLSFKPLYINPAALQEVYITFRKILTYYCNKVYICKIACRCRKIGCRPTKYLLLSPNGVLTLSNATEPTTSKLMIPPLTHIFPND